MDDLMLRPWMLRGDWRGDGRPLLIVDLDAWPATEAIAPLPPMPVLAFGDAAHPQAGGADVLVEPPFTLAALVAAIARQPRAAAVTVQLLRAIEGQGATAALTAESLAMATLQASPEHAAWLASRPAATALPPGMLHLARNGATLTLGIDRPCARNAIDRSLRDALFEAFALAALDPSIEEVRLRAEGRAFGIGADLAEFGTTRDPLAAHLLRARTLPTFPLARMAARLEVHVQGACVGASLELAAFAQRLTAAPDAWFQLPELAMGLLPGFGGCVSVPRRIGRRRAALLILSGRRIGTPTASAWGLIDAVVDAAPADDRGPHPRG